MAKFLNTSDISSELHKLIRNAEAEIILISPFIKLHPNIRSILEIKKGRDDIKIIVVFGKNKDNPALSLRVEDLSFFQEFPNVEIRYSERLHAKYYANENTAILTSMNLYDFSQNNNIEFGILVKTNLIKDIAVGLAGDGSLDVQAYNYFIDEIIPTSNLIFQKEPQYDKGIAGTGLNKKYLESVVIRDNIEEMFNGNQTPKNPTKSIPKILKQAAPGFCIRTGTSIPFNPNRPMSEDSFKNWSKFSNRDYPEKYCHFSGEASNGETSFAKPILRKNWNKAKEIHGL